MKLKKVGKVMLFASLSLLLVGCNNTPSNDEDNDGDTDNEVTNFVSINSVIEELRKGFTLTGSVEVNTSYYEDSSYQIPDDEVDTKTDTYTFTLVYQNDDDYVGVDRRFYQEIDGEEVYLFGENSFDDDGYVGIRYLNYDNTLETTLGVDSDGELAIYALNGLLNPFTIVQRDDFTQVDDEGTFELSTSKASVFYGELFSTLPDYLDAVSFKEASFNFTSDTLTSAHFDSYNVDSTITTTVSTPNDSYHTTYPRYQYTADLYFSNIGTSSAEDLITVEPEKEENAPLEEALEYMSKSTGFTYRRRSTPYVDGEYAGRDEVVNIYYNGNEDDPLSYSYVYEQTYALTDPDELTSDPTSPSTADFLLYNSLTNGVLYVYQLDDTTTGDTNTFERNSSGYSHLEGQYYYNDLFSYMNFGSFMSANIFNINEDGSYSPTIDNLQYIAGECFMSNLDTYSQIYNGYVTDVRVYVEESEEYDSYVISEIVVEYNQDNEYSGTVTFEYTDYNNSRPSFDFTI